LTRYKYLTFDCYGTLIDWRAGIEGAFRASFGKVDASGVRLYEAYVAEEASQESSWREYSSVLAETSIRVAKRLGAAGGAREGRKFADSLPSWPPFPDTVDSLERLGKMGYERYILSNVDDALLKQTISRNGLEVDGYVTAEETHSYKPATGHWKRFLERTRSRVGEDLHVAQSVFHDIIPAQSLGFATAWVNRYREPLSLDVQPGYICGLLSDVVNLLSNER